MSTITKAFEDIQDLAKSTQSTLAAAPVAGFQSTHFWQAQDTFLKEFEKFSTAWFKRRHEGTQTAMETSKKIFEDSMGDPAAAMNTLTEWQKHSMERLAEDAKDYADMMSACAASAVSNEFQAIEESVDITKRTTKSTKSSPV